MKLFALFFLVLPAVLGYDYERGPVWKEGGPFPCPGLYCGRSELNETHFSSCGKCPRGFRVSNNSHSICQECTESPTLYDWFYLTFHVLFVLVLHFFFIDFCARRRSFSREVLICHVSAFCEVVISAILCVVVFKPVGEFRLMACRVQRMSDFYTFFHNPNPNYVEKLNCTQEAVYPLFTMVFVFYGFCALTMLCIRPWLSSKFLPGRGRSAIYAALYFLPILGVIHAVGGGLVYAAYPYIVLILSVISSATHFSYRLDQSAKSLILGCFKETRNCIILIGHWLLHGFGILAITQLKDPTLNLSLLCLTPIPAIFYCLSARFSDPVNFTNEMNT